MRFSTILLTSTIAVFSIATNATVYADVLKWVDKNGKTHYSNKEKKSSRNKAKIIKFVEYESSNDIEQAPTGESSPVTSKSKTAVDGDSFTDVANESVSNAYNNGRETIEELTADDSGVHRIILEEMDTPKSYIQRKSRNTRGNKKLKPEYTIAEYNQRCEDAREELIAPLRQEAIYSCMKMKHSMTRLTRDYCEEINEDFGDGGMNANGFYIQRMFHNITECQDAYEAWDRRSRKMRGYSEE